MLRRIYLQRPLETSSSILVHTLRPRSGSHQKLRHSSSSSSSASSTSRRINTLLARLPAFLHPYTSALRTAPVSHITSFLILHEITAIVPLVGLATAFHYAGWLPDAWVNGKRVNEGVERFGRYFGRKGWFGFTRADEEENLKGTEVDGDVNAVTTDPVTAIATDTTSATPSYRASEQGTRILIEVATAYAITKLLLPARVLLSVWAAPWFARAVLGRFGRLAGLLRGKRLGETRVGGKGERRSAAAGTGATGGGVVGDGSKKMGS